MSFPVPPNEVQRLSALAALQIMDTPPEEHFDTITRLAQQVFGVPIALISLIDHDRQWFKARCGIELESTPRELAFCNHTILDDRVLVVEDATQDPRFADNPFVTSEDGVRFYAGAPLVLASGVCVGTLCLVDVTPRSFSAEQCQILRDLAATVVAHLKLHEARGALAQKEKLLNASLHYMDQGIIMVDQDERVLLSNQRALDLLDLPADLLKPDTPYHAVRGYLLARREFEKCDPGFLGWLDSSDFRGYVQYERERPNGTMLDVRSVPLPHGGAVRTFTDVTERKRVEHEAAEKATQLRATLEAMDQGLLVVDADHRVSLYNQRALKLLDLPEKLLARRPLFEEVRRYQAEAGEFAYAPDEVMGLVMQEGFKVGPLVYERTRPNGTVLEIRTVPTEGGGAVRTYTDITQRKQAENEARKAAEALQRTERSLSSALRVASAVAFEWDLRTGHTVRSDNAPDVLGLRSGATDAFVAHVHPDDRARLESTIRAACAKGTAECTEVRFFRPAGEIWLKIWVQAEFDETGTPVRIFGIDQDITEVKRAEEALRESEARFRNWADHAPVMMWVTEPDGACTYLSQTWYAFTGQSPATGLGAGWLHVVHPDDRAQVERLFQEATEQQKVYRAEFRLRRADGVYRWVIDAAVPRLSENGSFCGFIGSVIDITDRRALEEQLRQSQKMEALGQLTGGIAHDFNNLLTVILGNAELLTEDPTDPALTHAMARQIVETAERGADLNQKLLAFGRRQTLKPERVKVAQVIESMVPLLYRTIGEHIELETSLGDAALCALTDRTLLQNAVLNLVVNARDAMPHGGRLTIKTGERGAGRNEGGLPLGQPVVFVTVSDSGTGMPPEVLERVFEPFFTTKEPGKGTGLGLSMVFGFAEQTAGYVSIESAVDVGTSVTIVLPAVTESGSQPADHEVPTPATAPVAVKARILLVEDEPQVRQFVSSQLLTLGYEVSAAATGREALDLLERGACFDLLFTDVVLPKGMSGVELSQRAVKLCPGLKVLLTSGYSEQVFEHHGRPESIPLLPKPYRRKQLADALSQVLMAA